jgi:hypothetical protein
VLGRVQTGTACVDATPTLPPQARTTALRRPHVKEQVSDDAFDEARPPSRKGCRSAPHMRIAELNAQMNAELDDKREQQQALVTPAVPLFAQSGSRYNAAARGPRKRTARDYAGAKTRALRAFRLSVAFLVSLPPGMGTLKVPAGGAPSFGWGSFVSSPFSWLVRN